MSHLESLSGRFLWADSLKGFLIICVIVGHAIWYFQHDSYDHNHLFNLIYSFHMPCFMAVSGWLEFRPGDLLNCFDPHRYLRRCRQLLIPYFLWSLLQAFLLRGNFANMILNPDGYFWFLWSLFFIYVIFQLGRTVAYLCKKNEDMILLLICLSLMFIMVILNFRLFAFQFIAYYFIFYLFGYIFHKYNIQNLINRFSLVMMFVLWLFLAWFWTMHGLPEWMPKIQMIPNKILQFMYRGITALLAIVILLTILPTYFNRSSKTNDFICNMGRYSLGLYVVHLLIVRILVKYAPNIDWFGNLPMQILFSIFLVIISTGVVRLFMKSKLFAAAIGKI